MIGSDSINKHNMKKWIPWNICYCYDGQNYCKWHKDLTERNNVAELREKYCDYRKVCTMNCSKCDEPVTLCMYTGTIEVGEFPLADYCKICNEHRICYKI